MQFRESCSSQSRRRCGASTRFCASRLPRPTATTIVFGEHVILVLLHAPASLAGARARSGRRGRATSPRRSASAQAHPPSRRSSSPSAALPRRLHHAGRAPEGAAARRRDGRSARPRRAAPAALCLVPPACASRVLARRPAHPLHADAPTGSTRSSSRCARRCSGRSAPCSAATSAVSSRSSRSSRCASSSA